MHIITWVIISILFLILVVCYLLRRRWAIKKVKCISEEEKVMLVNAALKPFGFAFDSCQDIVISQNDSWQKNFGYMDLYDLKAPFLRMVFNSEPICFEYDDKEYRIEFWKGQYGIATGAEVGVYVRDTKSEMPHSFYRAATDDECLDIAFKLTKKCDLFSLCDKTWWLAGFNIGMFSRPKDLMMSICITFPNDCMKEAFLESLINSGYSICSICICDNTVIFEYCCPHNYKLNKRHKFIKGIAQIFNYINCYIYNFFTRFFCRTLDKLSYIIFMFPHFYHLIIGLALRRKKKRHHK